MQQAKHPFPADNAFGNLPAFAGVSLKPQHYENLLEPDVTPTDAPQPNPNPNPAWVELHPQNYFGVGGQSDSKSTSQFGGPAHRWLSAIAGKYPLSFHSVGLSLGSADGLNENELENLKRLCDQYAPAMVSDHLSFSGNAHHRFADLLPIPYTTEALDHFAKQIARVQDQLRRNILIENPSRYLAYKDDNMDEVTFIEKLVQKTGCGIIFDINNVEVSCGNLNQSANAYIDAIDPAWVGEIHLAGHAVEQHENGPLRIDDHGSPVSDVTWKLFERFIARSGPKPVLIEWDTDVPEFNILMEQAAMAQSVLNKLAPTADRPADMVEA